MLPGFPNSFVSDDDFKLFHSIDRELYSLLVITFSRDPMECMQIMALWLWLERAGFSNIIHKMLSLPSTLINELADEALICLNYINNGQIIEGGTDIPLMQSLVKKEISLQTFIENRLNATQGVTKVMNEVCTRALSDIMQMVVERNATQSIANCETLMANLNISTRQPAPQRALLAIPPIVPQSSYIPTGLFGNMPADLGFVQASEVIPEVPAEDRTMFLTFSKGYPVSEKEVRDFFAKSYGDCIESLYMQEVRPNEQSLFARLVFRTPSTIGFILSGMTKAKFTINGKHVWARKFVPKRPRPPPTPLPAPPPLAILPRPPPPPPPPPY
ncbi:uncharacterized protein LOC110817650 [Carica papaya]|uniref:uncharacterized protein LOC110817650 n=1 Tax=Carica papaya TaxID=3649 RepID=UPI000B8CC7E0|nr:uncharacterized protein LOC110817650 [Carica papaya]